MNVRNKDGIELSYKYHVLREKGNKKIANKAYQKDIKLIAVKITNHTDSVINIGRNAIFYSGENQIFPMEPIAVKNSVKQSVIGYLPYLLFTFLNLYISNGNTTQTYPIGLILGPGLTVGNMVTASSANSNMLYELIEYNIYNRDIQEGETVYGIIGVQDMGVNPITLKIKQ